MSGAKRLIRAAATGRRRCIRGRAHVEDPFRRRCAVCGKPAEWYLLAPRNRAPGEHQDAAIMRAVIRQAETRRKGLQ